MFVESNSVSLLKKYWFRELGCASETFGVGKTLVVSHGTLTGYKGIIAFKFAGACIVSCPADFVPTLRNSLTGVATSVAFNPSYLENLPGIRVDRVIGPAWLGQITEADFLPQHGPETRELSPSDIPLIKDFLASCSQQDIAVSSLEPERHLMFGTFVRRTLGAISNFEVLGGCVAHIGILTASKLRGQGIAKKAISLATATALKSALGIQYRTLVSNVPAIKAARRVGFSDFAETIAVRLK